MVVDFGSQRGHIGDELHDAAVASFDDISGIGTPAGVCDAQHHEVDDNSEIEHPDAKIAPDQLGPNGMTTAPDPPPTSTFTDPAGVSSRSAPDRSMLPAQQRYARDRIPDPVAAVRAPLPRPETLRRTAYRRVWG